MNPLRTNKEQILPKRCPNCETGDPWKSVIERQSQESDGKFYLLEVYLLKCYNCGYRIIPDKSVDHMLRQIGKSEFLQEYQKQLTQSKS
jgi:uncharacterized Zn finger protein